MTTQNSNLPWWLADLYPQPEDTNAAAQPEPATVRGAQAIAAELRPAGVAPMNRPAPPVQSWDSLARVPAAAPAVSPNGWKPQVPAIAAVNPTVAYKPAVHTATPSPAEWKPAVVPQEMRQAWQHG